MESVVTRARLRDTRDYLTPSICSLIKPAAMEKYVIPRQNPRIHVIISNLNALSQWGWVKHIIVSDNGLTPGQRQTISWTYDWILLIGPLETNFSEIVIKIHKIFVPENAFETVVWKLGTIFIGLNVLLRIARALMCLVHRVKWHWFVADEWLLAVMAELGVKQFPRSLPSCLEHWMN